MAFSKEQLTDPGCADTFAISYAQLCDISYDTPGSISGDVAKVNALGTGTWQCVWGPALDANDANLVYMASYTDISSSAPALLAVVIRGTDPDSEDPGSTLIQAFEDLDVTTQTPLPWLTSSSGEVADGTLDALKTIQGLTDPTTNTGLAEFVASFLGASANQQPVLLVTGHSLGGCLTTVVAPWLQATLSASGLSNTIVPVTFAAPTAGNGTFANSFSTSFTFAPRYVNSLDIVPNAWGNVWEVDRIYGPYNLDAPITVLGAVADWSRRMQIAGVSYAQPQSPIGALTGEFVTGTPAPDWDEEALDQHHTVNYLSLLHGSPVSSDRLIPAVPRRNVRRTSDPTVEAVPIKSEIGKAKIAS